MTDTISLTIPADTRYQGVATLVLGGIGSRLDLPYERVDDLQLAVLSVLEATRSAAVTMDVDSDGKDVVVSIGPVADGSGADDAFTRVLTPLVDEVGTVRRDGAEWVTLRLSGTAGS